MKNKHIEHIIPILLMGFLCVFSSSSCSDGPGNKMGEELKQYLNQITAPKDEKKNYYQYAALPTQYKTSDNDPSKEGNVRLFYTSKSYTWVPWGMMGTDDNSIQREHVWPQSRFRKYGNSTTEAGVKILDSKLSPYNDAHNVRPAMGKDNKDHSNKFYGEEYLFDPNSIDGYDTEHSYRGDIARILFYMAVRYDMLEIVDTYNESVTNQSYQIGKLSYLLKWNLENPVSDREIQRNDAIEKGKQGNRNPFIDHPDYACRIWGNTNDVTKGICGYDK